MSGSPTHILVVDDDPLFVSCISRQLRAAGFTTSSASDGICCEQQARTQPFGLIVLDMHMSGGSGLDTLKALRDCAGTRAIPVVMLSGSDSEFEIARQMGAAGTLLKPFRQAELLSVVRRVLGNPGRAGPPPVSGSPFTIDEL